MARAQNGTEQNPSDPLVLALEFLNDPAVRDGAVGPGLQALDRVMQDLDINEPEGLPRAALAARLERQLSKLPYEARTPILEAFGADDNLAGEVAFLLGPLDDIPGAYGVLQSLLDAHGERVGELAPLAAAMCAVHDRPAERRVNQQTLDPIDAVALFGYYEANERSMLFKLRDLPASALVHLVDGAGTLEEYEWARRRYGRDRQVGNRYQEINYDTRAFRQEGAQKRLASVEYTLEAIRQVGGICADQAYFAESVGQACGVPACTITGKGGGVSHAWMGFLERDGRAAHWNFSSGRYPEFEDVQGSVLDPQTGDKVADATVAIGGLSTKIAKDKRWQSIALVDASDRLAYQSFLRGVGPDQELVTAQFAMLEAALRLDPGNTRAWTTAGSIVATEVSTLEQKEYWTRAVDQLAAQTHPDFAFQFLKPIFDAEPDLATRLHLWDWAADRFKRRPDLAARARLAQARIMVEQGRREEAITTARAAFDEYGNKASEGYDALTFAEGLYEELGRGQDALKMYEQAFRRLRKPGRMQAAFLSQTTWFRVGSRYAALLEMAGLDNEAANIRRRLEP